MKTGCSMEPGCLRLSMEAFHGYTSLQETCMQSAEIGLPVICYLPNTESIMAAFWELFKNTTQGRMHKVSITKDKHLWGN